MINIEPIGYVRGGRVEVEDDAWGMVRSAIDLVDRFGEEALFGLADFSHVEVIYQFHKVDESKVENGARHPRNNKAWPLVGIFAQRGKNRPNRIGLCTCRIVRVEGRTVELEGLDAVDGSPVLDLKPVMAEFLPREPVVQPGWSAELMRNYW